MIWHMSPDRTVVCGQFLRSARLRRGLDQAALAKLAGTDQPAISRIERGVVSPTLETLNRLLEAMGDSLMLSSLSLEEPVPGGSNQRLAEVLADYRELTPEDRLVQAAKLSEVATELAAEAER